MDVVVERVGRREPRPGNACRQRNASRTENIDDMRSKEPPRAED